MRDHKCRGSVDYLFSQRDFGPKLENNIASFLLPIRDTPIRNNLQIMLMEMGGGKGGRMPPLLDYSIETFQDHLQCPNLTVHPAC